MRRLILCLIVSLWASSAWAAPSIVNVAKGGGGGSATTIVSAAADHTSGNTLVVFLRIGSSSGSFTSVADTAGNTYTGCTILNASLITMQAFYVTDIDGHASNVVTATYDREAGFRWIYVFQIAGTGLAFDVCAQGETLSSTPTSPAFTTTQASAIVLAAVSQTNTLTYTAGTGYTLSDGNIEGFGGTESKIVSEILTNDTASFNSGGANSGIVLVTVIAEAGGGGGGASSPPALGPWIGGVFVSDDD